MDNSFTNIKLEIEKINLRIKEYLWEKQYLFKIRKKQFKNAGSYFLAGQK